MRIGFACICKSIRMEPANRKPQLKKLYESDNSNAIMKEAMRYNLWYLKKTIEWCINNNIRMYRMSSMIVPYASHRHNTWEWYRDTDVLSACKHIKELAKDIRLSMHLPPTTNINTPWDGVLASSIREINSHVLLCKALGANDIIIHVGGRYEDKERASLRFINRYNDLHPIAKEMLALENDDKIYTIEDIVNINKQCGIKLVADLHHHHINGKNINIEDYRNDLIKSWKGRTPKIHLSSGRGGDAEVRAHSDFVTKKDLKKALEFVRGDFDIMVEAKQKDLAVLDILKKIEEMKNG